MRECSSFKSNAATHTKGQKIAIEPWNTNSVICIGKIVILTHGTGTHTPHHNHQNGKAYNHAGSDGLMR